MSNPPLSSFSDSPRGSVLHPVHPSEVPLQTTQGMSYMSSTSQPTQSWNTTVPTLGDNADLTSSDKLSALPGNTIPLNPYRTVRNERNLIPPSPSAPSLLVRPFTASPKGYDVKPLTTEGSNGQNSSHQRVSFENDRASATTPNHSPRTNFRVHPLLREGVSQTAQGIGSTMTRMNHSSEPSRPSSAVRSAMAGITNPPKKPGHESPPTASASHSRATSPIRFFGWSGFHHAQEEAFVPVDPFRARARLRRFSFHSSDIEHHLPLDSTCKENLLFCFPSLHCRPEDRLLSFLRDARYFILDTLPRQLYLHLLFRLPSLYFSRIARVYEDAQLSKPDLDRMIESYSTSRQQEQRQRIVRSSPIPPGAHYHPGPALPFPDEWTTTNVSPALIRFKQSWETFIDSLLREWKTLNLVSALLNSAILSMFQSQVMANDPIIRTAALLSLTSALISLSYGCIYIVRFGTMRSMYKAARWAEEAARTTTFILWNVWVLLAMPAIWLAWSMIFFVFAILTFVWRYGSSTDPASPEPLSPTAAVGPRIAISALFLLGLIYLAAIVKTLHNYGRSSEHRLFSRTSVGNRMPDTAEAEVRGREQDSRRGRGTIRSYESDDDRARENSRHGREQTEPGKLSAVTGLGLRSLDDLANPRTSDEMPTEKQRHRTETNV